MVKKNCADWIAYCKMRKGEKWRNPSSLGEITPAVMESSGTLDAGPKTRGIARELDITNATVRKILKKTSCEFWLWGYINTHAYCGGVVNLSALKDRITPHVRNIDHEELHSVVEHVFYALIHCSCIAHYILKRAIRR
ncbi:hypothetical protein NPIL_360331 [Nephila pilipes]|uniref:Uncharacterized protein n=1 Tax=Nephila pilipes TaxID=299642 RepID=A0A8X6UQ43_NEPPI|nr:hypothetical protein NPIL_360331 [Nephila pilipes]